MERNILQAQHLPGVLNMIADEESRTWSDRSEWKLSPVVFKKINGTIVHRPVCKQTIFTASTICELEARSPGSSCRRLYSGFEHPSREVVCQSSFMGPDTVGV